MDTIESYEPTPPQKAFHKSDAPFKAFIGGFGAGKTKAGIWEAIDQGLRYPGGRLAIMRDTLPDLRDSTMQSFFEECPEELIYSYRRRDNTVMFKNGTEFLFRSFRQYASSAKNQFESKIKALNLSAFYIDEANETIESNFLLLHGRLRHTAVPRHAGWITSNPPNNDHWIVKYFIDEKTADRKNYFYVKASSRENPHLPTDFVAKLESKYPPGWVKKFIDGEVGFMTTGDPVYEGFREGWNTQKTRVISGRTVHRYWDFGWHRPAVIWAQVTVDGQWRIHKEKMGHNIYLHDFAPQVVQLSNELFPKANFLDYGDPAGLQRTDKGRTSIEILRGFGVNVDARYSQIKEGLDLIQQKITTVVSGEPALIVDPDGCPILVAGFLGGYAREKALDGRGMVSSEPIKDGYYEHVHDALRYGAINVFGANQAKNGDFEIRGPSWAMDATNKGVSTSRPSMWNVR